MCDETRLRMSKGTAGSKLPPKWSKRKARRKASSQTVGIRKKKPTELSAKATAVSEMGPKCASL